jgi:hypothetical protein
MMFANVTITGVPVYLWTVVIAVIEFVLLNCLGLILLIRLEGVINTLNVHLKVYVLVILVYVLASMDMKALLVREQVVLMLAVGMEHVNISKIWDSWLLGMTTLSVA